MCSETLFLFLPCFFFLFLSLNFLIKLFFQNSKFAMGELSKRGLCIRVGSKGALGWRQGRAKGSQGSEGQRAGGQEGESWHQPGCLPPPGCSSGPCLYLQFSQIASLYGFPLGVLFSRGFGISFHRTGMIGSPVCPLLANINAGS